jgi:hypothetical protein
MLMIRHAIGSRLLYQTDQFSIEQKNNNWKISMPVKKDEVQEVLKLKEELNLFEVKENEKAWYYSSDARIEFNDGENHLIILADHKTVYPVS